MSTLKEAHGALRSAAKATAEQSIDIDYATDVLLRERGERPERVVVLWAQMAADTYKPQLVAAFHGSEVECIPEMHEERVAEAKDWFLSNFCEDGDVLGWFTTTALIPAPTEADLPASQESEDGR